MYWTMVMYCVYFKQHSFKKEVDEVINHYNDDSAIKLKLDKDLFKILSKSHNATFGDFICFILTFPSEGIFA